MTKKLNFKVSAGLKNIIGKELITNKFVAIFELVKNSFDANSKKVDITFNYKNGIIDSIDIQDYGNGMSYDQIINNWLNVAYSDKKPQNAEKKGIGFERTQLGAKGVGRFSCDIVGSIVNLYTRKLNEPIIHHIMINWDNFENVDEQSFLDIPVEYEGVQDGEFSEKGTLIKISNLRESWDRNELLELKRMLMKLISPNTGDSSEFIIELHAEQELVQDKFAINERDVVNGVIKNTLFESLNIKTIALTVDINSVGEEVTTVLNDKGQEVFYIKETNQTYQSLKDIHLKLFYMNRKAKLLFAKIMGIAQVSYGNIFIFKNGFRILPYGEKEDDFFGINLRQQQGTKRYFGTRDLVGRIEINGEAKGFVEVSSRDKGFIKSKQVDELKSFFVDKMKILETYVVDVLDWGDPDGEKFDSNVINFEKLVKQIAGITKKSNPLEIRYDANIIAEVAKRAADTSIQSSLDKILVIAEKNNNDSLMSLVNSTKKKVDYLNETNKKLTKQNEEKDKRAEEVKKELERVSNQMYFLENTSNTDFVKAKEIIHLDMVFANKIKEYLEVIFENIKSRDEQHLLSNLAQVDFLASKIYSISNFGLKANFSLKSDIQIDSDLIAFIEEYVKNIYDRSPNLGMNVKIINQTEKQIKIKFSASEIVAIIENLISNANKANAKNLYFQFSNDDRFIIIDAIDDGDGLDKTIKNKTDIFNLGYTTTIGSGIGLYTIKNVLKNMNGTIEIIDTSMSFALRMKIDYGYKI